jgi:hypothetical protein
MNWAGLNINIATDKKRKATNPLLREDLIEVRMLFLSRTILDICWKGNSDQAYFRHNPLARKKD